MNAAKITAFPLWHNVYETEYRYAIAGLIYETDNLDFRLNSTKEYIFLEGDGGLESIEIAYRVNMNEVRFLIYRNWRGM